MDYNKQAKDFLKATGCTLEVRYLRNVKHFENDKYDRDIYEIVITKGRRVFAFEFGQSINNSTPNRTPPTEYDVLTCLTKYDVGDFEEFCDEFGYDTDSRSAERTYKAVLDEWLNVQRLWTNEEIELLQEIQ